MKKILLNALVVVSILATLSSCSKDEQLDIKPAASAYNPLDPNNNGYIALPEGEFNYYNDNMFTYTRVGKNYLLMKPLSLEKYKNGSLLDSVCNEDIAIRFETKAVKTYDKTAPWGAKPRVVNEYAPIVTITGGVTITIKLSKMATAFGFELNSLFKGYGYGITADFWNSKLNYKIPNSYTSFLSDDTRFGPVLGSPGGALITGVKSKVPFDEIRFTFEPGFAPSVYPPLNISLGGFRYILAK
jgi:hypothetical protein